MKARDCAPSRPGLTAALIASLTVAVTVLGAGCGSAQARGTPSPSTAAARPSTSAALQIVSPVPNQRTGSDIDVDLHLDGAHLVPATQVSGVLRPDEGHIHLLVDGQLVAMPFRLVDRLPVLTPGPHTVEAEFVASDHLPFSNRVVAAVTFTVR